MKLLNFEKALKAATSVRQLEQQLEQYLTSVGIDNFAFTYYSYYPNSLNKIKYSFASSHYMTWHEHFVSEGYDDIDSTLDEVYQTILPIYWNLSQQLQEAKTPREIQMRQDSIAFGIEEGLSIPVHGPQEDFAILVLIKRREQNYLGDWEELQHKLFPVAYYYYYYLQKQLLLEQSSTPEKNQLNPREVQCLTLVAKQYSVTKIAKTLNITERTVNYHIQRLNKKLGTKNKYQSVIKALQKNLIKL